MYQQQDFKIETVLSKPLMASIATECADGPRDSPVWFLFEKDQVHIFGTHKDSFIQRLDRSAKCAFTVVDFRNQDGILRHVGIRGDAQIRTNPSRALIERFVGKYLGKDTGNWNKWFIKVY